MLHLWPVLLGVLGLIAAIILTVLMMIGIFFSFFGLIKTAVFLGLAYYLLRYMLRSNSSQRRAAHSDPEPPRSTQGKYVDYEEIRD